MKVLLWSLLIAIALLAISVWWSGREATKRQVVIENKITSLVDSVEQLTIALKENVMADPVPGELVEAWVYLDGGVQKVHRTITKKLTGETDPDWHARHDAQVVADRIAFPPI